MPGLAELAARHGYCRPEIVAEPVFEVEAGRHPVLDAILSPGDFVPNDVHLGGDAGSILLITGPNMAGKSTYIRQVALIAIMAHLGSFVPAKRARIGVVDRLFARVGATDDLSRSQSTFMVEMSETANILNNATPQEPGHPRRGRPRHQHVRRHLAGLGDHRAHPRRRSAAARSSPRTTTSWSSSRKPSRD